MKKGFTLIELLAVIVILAIIALIATPIVLNIINDTKESATLRSADFYLDALELSIAQSVLESKNINDGTYNLLENGNVCLKYEDTTCTDELEVEVNGETPTTGNVEIKEGNIGYVELTIGGNLVTKTASGELINGHQTICESVTTATIGNVPEGNYINGDEYICEVKPGTKYRFFVTDSTSEYVYLIMYANINSDGTVATQAIKESASTNGVYSLTPMVSLKDYVDAGGSASDYGEMGKMDKGPITAMEFLKTATSSWINIKKVNLPSQKIASFCDNSQLNCSPIIINDAMESGYWLSNYASSDSSYAVHISYSMRGFNVTWCSSDSLGIRPEIRISKNNIK